MSVSIVVATYGDPEWKTVAERAYLSVLGQGAHDIVVYHDDNGNVATSRNAAAARTTGEWLLFVDADDQIAPGYVGAMRRALEREGTDGEPVLLTPAVQTVRHGRFGSTPTFFKEVPLRQANWLVIGTLVHRDLFWKAGGFPDYPHGFEDFALWSKCVRLGATIVKVPDAVYRYHTNPNSKHRQGWRDKKTQAATHHRVISELDEWEAARV